MKLLQLLTQLNELKKDLPKIYKVGDNITVDGRTGTVKACNEDYCVIQFSSGIARYDLSKLQDKLNEHLLESELPKFYVDKGLFGKWCVFKSSDKFDKRKPVETCKTEREANTALKDLLKEDLD